MIRLIELDKMIQRIDIRETFLLEMTKQTGKYHEKYMFFIMHVLTVCCA